MPCICLAGSCPVAAIKGLCANKQPYQHVVLTDQGRPVPKEEMVEALKGYGRWSGMLDVSLITGHSMRVTGAQRLAKAGLAMDQIAMFGRWKSLGQMYTYLRETAIGVEIMKDALRRNCSSVEADRVQEAPHARVRRWEQAILRRS